MRPVPSPSGTLEAAWCSQWKEKGWWQNDADPGKQRPVFGIFLHLPRVNLFCKVRLEYLKGEEAGTLSRLLSRLSQLFSFYWLANTRLFDKCCTCGSLQCDTRIRYDLVGGLRGRSSSHHLNPLQPSTAATIAYQKEPMSSAWPNQLRSVHSEYTSGWVWNG